MAKLVDFLEVSLSLKSSRKKLNKKSNKTEGFGKLNLSTCKKSVEKRVYQVLVDVF